MSIQSDRSSTARGDRVARHPREVVGGGSPREAGSQTGLLGRGFSTARSAIGDYRRGARNWLGETMHRVKLSMAPTLCISRIDRSNIGDMKAAPREYFGFLRESTHMDIHEYIYFDPRLASKVVVVGGGGIFVFPAEIGRIVTSRGATLICWGAGHNTHGSSQIGRIDMLDRFQLVGTRDYGYGYEWVPCASCMDPAFDRDYPIEHDVVIYDHQHYPFRGGDPSIPRLSNACTDFGQVIAFLGSAETVVTTSYHGAYWATLLGRRAVVVDPFSSKFYGFRHAPVLSSAEDWRRAVEEARSYPAALSECRAANQAFAEKVYEVIERQGRRGRVRRPPAAGW